MSRGRKKNVENSHSTWEQIFNKNIGQYIQAILIELAGESHFVGDDNASDLLDEIRTVNKKVYPEVKAQEKSFAIPGNCIWVRLGEVGICKTGTTPPTADKDNFGCDIPFIKPADITLTKIVYDNEALSNKGIEQGVLIPKGSLLMVCIGGSIGKSFYL